MNKREMNRILRQVRDEVPNQVRATLAEHNITKLPTPEELKKLSPEALGAFARVAQGDARIVGRILLPNPRPRDYVRGVAMVGMLAGHLIASHRYDSEGDYVAGGNERYLAHYVFVNLVPRWVTKRGVRARENR